MSDKFNTYIKHIDLYNGRSVCTLVYDRYAVDLYVKIFQQQDGELITLCPDLLNFFRSKTSSHYLTSRLLLKPIAKNYRKPCF